MREREEIWREKEEEEELACPPFLLSSLLFSLSPLPLSVFFSFTFFSDFLGESVRSKVNRK